MTTLVDIKKSINTVLKKRFPEIKIYPGETKEGFERPAFFTQVIPLISEYETVNFTSDKLLIAINYFSETCTELENIKMHDAIKKAFGMTLDVNQRSFLLKNIRSEIVDDVLQFKFELDYFTKLSRVNEHESMKELNLRVDKE